MQVIKAHDYLVYNEEMDVISFLEENAYYILLSAGRIFLTKVLIDPKEINMDHTGLIEVWGSIVVPSGTFEEASLIVKNRPYNEQLLGRLKSMDDIGHINLN